ncbi:glycosyltransferase [Actinokineospora diospyrosa]|uniref:4,4'-diaponeurosporenoate glycosyltransferase n=1 Tax=Actinokineospora diospyrosa TaxID=103728 RepID=A0ABT1I9M8_9PSEU|nr:glycosyltransferase [Actinokineospora diospyrosa]MCP2269101.1 Glycosyltransferase involved in cell wall bisynthesis [Actinokineospora diospyrosa]
MIDVVVPARDEGALVGACVRSALVGSADLDVRVVVVANGCSDDTAERAREAGAVVVETAGEGKAAALNVGLGHCREGAVVFLDADTVLTPGTLGAMAAALDVPRPRLVGPRPLLVEPDGWLARGFAAVWTRLPGVADDVVGAGCYAVNAAGRDLVPAFPDVVADDAWARTRFAERVVAGTFLFVLPRGRELVDVVRRWRDGNAALPESPSASTARNLTFIARRPRLWPRLPAFLAVLVLGRRRRGWARADGVRQPGRMASSYTFLTSATPADDAYDQLYAVASRFPRAGVYGAGPGELVRYGKPVGVALVETALWERIGRPTDLGVLHTRSRAVGATPMTTPLARFTAPRPGLASAAT